MPQVKQELNVGHLIEEATNLEKERKTFQTRLMKNREILRLLADNGVLTSEQETVVNRVYPKKVRGVRFYGPNGQKLQRPVYSAIMGELEGQPVTDEDLQELGIELAEIPQEGSDS